MNYFLNKFSKTSRRNTVTLVLVNSAKFIEEPEQRENLFKGIHVCENYRKNVHPALNVKNYLCD